MEIVEEPKENESIPLRVVTRAQAQQQNPQEHEKEGLKMKPRRKTRRKALNKVVSPKNSQLGGNMSEAKKGHKESLEGNSKTSSRGLVLLEKVNENLESLLKAFEGQISKGTILLENLQEYPNPIEEGHRLARHMKLIRDTQTQWEAPPIVIFWEVQKKDMLETIDENHSYKLEPKSK